MFFVFAIGMALPCFFTDGCLQEPNAFVLSVKSPRDPTTAATTLLAQSGVPASVSPLDLFTEKTSYNPTSSPRQSILFGLNSWFYLPIQKLEKISPNKSSEVNSPVISDKARCASLNSSANNSP